MAWTFLMANILTSEPSIKISEEYMDNMGYGETAPMYGQAQAITKARALSIL